MIQVINCAFIFPGFFLLSSFYEDSSKRLVKEQVIID